MRDAGLQAERTALAWSRTVLAVLANALILMRAGVVHESEALTVISVLLLAAAAATHALSRRRRAALMARELPTAPPWRALIGVAAITTVASLGGILAIAATLRG